MSLNTFKIRCGHGHAPIELIGEAAVIHAQDCMGRKVGKIWTEVPGGPAWSRMPHHELRTWKPATAFKPFPWVAPKRTAANTEAVAKWIESGLCTYEYVETDDESAA